MQYFPENEQLIEKMNYYSLFVPISIHRFSPFEKGQWPLSSRENVEDHEGNKYGESFVSRSGGYCWQRYDIGNNYNTLSGTISISHKYLQDAPGHVTIYGDGQTLYLSPDNDVSIRPTDISVDITGISVLTIEIYATTNIEILFSNIMLQRTAK